MVTSIALKATAKIRHGFPVCDEPYARGKQVSEGKLAQQHSAGSCFVVQ